MNSRSECDGVSPQSQIFASAAPAPSSVPSPPGQSLPSTPPQSPASISEKILELELRLQTECSLQLEAIEYWECIGDMRYLKIKDRMHWFLRRKDVIALLKGTTKPLASLPIHQCHNRPLFPTSNLELQGTPKSAQDLLSFTAVESKETVEGVKDDLKNQNESLQKRLKVRKHTKSWVKTDAAAGLDGECEKMEVLVKKNNFEDALEKLLEQLFEKRLRAKQELSAKYASQLQELQPAASNPLIAKVIQQLKTTETAEMTELESCFLLERNKAIEALRSHHFA